MKLVMIDKALFKLPNFLRVMFGLGGIIFLQALSIIGQSYFLTATIVCLWHGQGLSWNLVYFFLLFALRHLLTVIRENRLDNYAYMQAESTRRKLLNKIFSLGPNLVQKEGTGNVVTTVFEGISEMENYIQLVLSKMVAMMVMPVLFLIVIFIADPLSGVILFIVFPLVILFMIILGYAAQSRAEKQYKNYQILSNHFMDSLRGLETLKVFGLSKAYAKGIYATSERFRKSTMRTLQIAFMSTFALDFFTTLSIAIVAVFLGLRLLNGNIDLFPALFVLVMAPEYFLPLRDFAGDYHATLNGKNAMQAIKKVLEVPETTDRDVLQLNSWTNTSHLTIKNLNFKYEENGASVAFDFDWTGFGKIGIIGASGAGKSTLIQILSGFLQAQVGEIYVNDKEIPHFAQHTWQENLNLIPQKTYIFHGTLQENICLYTPDATDQEVARAVKAAGLSGLNLSLDTIIGEGARQLSGGQAQRVALARAFLTDHRKILLLDEPTAHLDIETEMEIKEELLPLLENKLVFLSTHRLHWMPQMNWILVIDKGNVVAQGKHEDLLETSKAYQRLIAEMRGEQQ